ncbi:MAG TPA: metallophosphoesterase family protein [Planctomycetaceae bacterium]|nr:metallophosphoesterase family protein [Planctomycetaceae bacterium]
MRIGVVSDTHGHVDYTLEAVRVLRELDVSTVLHCGDIGSAAIVPLFADWPTHFVFGNVDYDERELTLTIRNAGQTCHGRFGELTLEGVSVALLHSDDESRFFETIDSGRYGLVCYGHTHKAEQHREGSTLVLNPGALYRATPHSFAIVELPQLAVTHIDL